MNSTGLASAFGALTVAAVLSSGCTIERADVRTPSGEPPEADTTQVRKVMEAIARGFESADLLALDSIYHDSVLVFEAGIEDRGWLRYRDHHLVPELEALSDRRFVLEGIRVRRAGTTAWATFRYTFEAVHEDEAVSVRGVGTMIFQKLRGRWRLVHSHTSAPRGAGG